VAALFAPNSGDVVDSTSGVLTDRHVVDHHDGYCLRLSVLPSEMQTSTWYKVSCAWQLLRVNPKMKYMVGFNAVFGFAYPFVNAYVNGEVVGRVQPSQDPHQGHVGLFSALSATMAAICS
jgi:hypothetical protein